MDNVSSVGYPRYPILRGVKKGGTVRPGLEPRPMEQTSIALTISPMLFLNFFGKNHHLKYDY